MLLSTQNSRIPHIKAVTKIDDGIGSFDFVGSFVENPLFLVGLVLVGLLLTSYTDGVSETIYGLV